MSSRDILTSEGQTKDTTATPRDSTDIFDDLTLKVCQISSTIGIACQMIPYSHMEVYSMLRLLQQSLEDVKVIANELLERVPS